MLNKYILTFRSESLEAEYRESQSLRIKSEYRAFSFQATLFLIFFSIYYFKSHIYFYFVVACSLLLILLLIGFHFLIKRNPHLVNYILPLLQVAMGLIQTIDYLVTIEDDYYVESPNVTRYNWYYGFQSCYFHMALLVQGYLVWPQFVVIACIILGYISYSPSRTPEYVSLYLSFVSVLIGMMFIKYQLESNKRLQFLHERERRKWLQITEQVLTQSVIMIKLDATQDQLRIHRMNHAAKEHLKIKEDSDLRTLLRNIKPISTQAKSTKSLEAIIRRMLQLSSPHDHKNKKKKTNVMSSTDQSEHIIKSMDCHSQILGHNYRVQLVRYWIDDQQMVIMASENLFDSGEQHFQVENRCKTKILKYLSLNALRTFAEGQHQIKRLISLNHFASIDLWLDMDQIFNSQRHILKSSKLLTILSRYLGDGIPIHATFKSPTILVSVNSVILVVTSLMQLLSGKEEISLKIIEKGDEVVKSTTFTLSFQRIQIHPLLLQFLQKPLFFIKQEQEPSLRQQFEKALQSLEKRVKHRHPLLSLSLVSMKFVLWHFGTSNKIKISEHNNTLNLSFQLMSS